MGTTLKQMTPDQKKALDIFREAYHTDISYQVKNGTLQPADDAARAKARNDIFAALVNKHRVPVAAIESLLSLPPMVLAGVVNDAYPMYEDDAPPMPATVTPPPVPATRSVAPTPTPTPAIPPAAVANPVAAVDPSPAPDPAPDVPLVSDAASTPAGIKSTWASKDEKLVGIGPDGGPLTMGYGNKVMWDNDTDPEAPTVRILTGVLRETVRVLRDAGITHRYNVEDFELRPLITMSDDRLDALEARAKEDLGGCYEVGSEAMALRCVIVTIAMIRASKPSYTRAQIGYSGSMFFSRY